VTAAKKIIVCGTMGEVPFGGMAWQVMHHLEGFRRLGHEVFYVEDTNRWPYDPDRNTVTDDCAYAVRFIERVLDECGLGGRWAYKSASGGRDKPEIGGQVFGMTQQDLANLYAQADILINLTGSTELRDRQLDVPVRIYLETDPVLRQIEIAHGEASTIELLKAHTHHFTYGENIGSPACAVPTGMFQYQPTRPPVIVDWWETEQRPRECFTTIGNWRQDGKDLEWNGETYRWSKHYEFLKFLEVPVLSGECVELALSSVDAEAVDMLTSRSWRVVNSMEISRDIAPYLDYVKSSRGEFTVAKDQNVRLKSGWFSDRSACYLAAGRPVITQNTGFETVLPVGEGLFAFNTMEDILASLEAIRLDYDRHSRAASSIARHHFRAEAVLASLLRNL
jgi:hypothetical protein